MVKIIKMKKEITEMSNEELWNEWQRIRDTEILEDANIEDLDDESEDISEDEVNRATDDKFEEIHGESFVNLLK